MPSSAPALSPRIRRTVMRSLAALAAVCLSSAALADTTIRYTVLFDGRPGGSEVVTVRGDGRVDVDMSYRNNGRGPDIKEHSRLEPGAQNAAVALYAVLGIDTQPDFIWLTGEANPRLFAVVVPGFVRIVEQGWEGQGAELERLQVQAEHEWLRGLALKLAHRAADPILIRNVRVFDSEHARLLPPRDVYVYRGRIAA